MPPPVHSSTPSTATTAACCVINSAICPRCAPSAIRMPISRTRCATLKANTPYTPINARPTAMVPKYRHQMRRNVRRRFRPPAAPPCVAMLYTGMSGSNCCSASRKTGSSSCGITLRSRQHAQADDGFAVPQRRVDDCEVRLLLVQIFHLRIPDHADHGHPRGFGAAKLHSLADRILSRPDATCERSADDGNRGEFPSSCAVKSRPLELRYARCPENIPA